MTAATRYTETELIRLLKQKDPAAINILYDKYAPPIYGFICQVLQDTKFANESLVDVFLKITESVHQYNPSKSRFFTWMMQISGQVVLQKLKAYSNRTFADSSMTPVDGNRVAGLVGGEQEGTELAFLKGYSPDEVACKMGITASVVKEKMNRALLQINSKDEN